MNTDLQYLELLELASLLKTGEISSHEVTKLALRRIDQLDPHLASYAFVSSGEALASAKIADREIRAGRYKGPLHGVPVGIKDLFYTKGVRTAAGSTIHQDFLPPFDATVVARLRSAGAVILGKLQMTEGAYSDHHPSVIPPKNPWNAAYWTGISSSGCAVATAAGLCYGSLASDTGGSIRWPCGAAGLTGIKPTWGRVSRFGIFDLAPTLDHVGVMARSAADAATILDAIAGPDSNDTTTIAAPAPQWVSHAGARGLRVGIDVRWNTYDVDPVVQHVLDVARTVFAELGAEVIEVGVPDVQQAVSDWSPLCSVEAAVIHEGTYPARKVQYGPVLRSVLEAGGTIPATEFRKIQLRRRELQSQFSRIFQEIDLLLCPVQPFAPLTLEVVRTLGDQPELIAKLQRFTVPFNMTGAPTITLPGGFTDNRLPIGFQLVARHLQEPILIGAARAFQGATDWHRRHPSLAPVSIAEQDRTGL